MFENSHNFNVKLESGFKQMLNNLFGHGDGKS